MGVTVQKADNKRGIVRIEAYPDMTLKAAQAKAETLQGEAPKSAASLAEKMRMEKRGESVSRNTFEKVATGAASRIKMRKLHIVPLARQVVAILQDLQRHAGSGRDLFPSMRAKSAPLSDVTLLAALPRMACDKESMTVHGFRSMASTLLHDQGYSRDWTERQLARGERNTVCAACNYAEYLPERRRMMQEWAGYLDELSGTV